VSVFQSLDIYNDDVPRSAALNMALDEALWESATTTSLRIYQWDHPALSFGYFGRYRDVAAHANERELVRRCTGGGIVLHGDDLTYALVIPSTDLVASPLTVYALVHKVIQHALVESGLAATMAESGTHSGNNHTEDAACISPNDSDACFANPVASDVLVNGVKVAGAAQRRSRRGLLQQGSIQNIRLPQNFADRFAQRLSIQCRRPGIDSTILGRAHQIAGQKYATDAWLRKR
jgi:lipoate-protein ligase A